MKEELREFALSEWEWELVEFLLRFLEPFQQATMTIQCNDRPTLHKTFIMYEKLFNNVENVKAIVDKMSVVPEWFEEVRGVIDKMWEKIKIYYLRTKNPSTYVNVNILHPGKKLHLFKKKGSSFTEILNQVESYEKAMRV